MITCEHCGKDGVKIHQAHSMLVVLQRVNKDGYAFYQCDQGANPVNGRTMQHWHCTRDEMKAKLANCINEHYSEEKLQPIPENQVQLHKVVLSYTSGIYPYTRGKNRESLRCKICTAAITGQAYRFCLTHATPANSVPDDSHNDLGEWCCSLEHAKQSAIITVSQQ